MNDTDILQGKRILVVDDEPDVLETLEELFYMCEVDAAGSFEDATALLKANRYDAAVLDIMGVEGYALLEITHRLNIPTLMLTAHALTPDNLKGSVEKGADAYVPKDKMVDMPIFTADVLAARNQGRQANARWYSFLVPLFNRLFGKNWQQEDTRFWETFEARYRPGGGKELGADKDGGNANT